MRAIWAAAAGEARSNQSMLSMICVMLAKVHGRLRFGDRRTYDDVIETAFREAGEDVAELVGVDPETVKGAW